MGLCGTPLKSDLYFEAILSTTTHCIMSVSHFSIQLDHTS